MKRSPINIIIGMELMVLGILCAVGVLGIISANILLQYLLAALLVVPGFCLLFTKPKYNKKQNLEKQQDIGIQQIDSPQYFNNYDYTHTAEYVDTRQIVKSPGNIKQNKSNHTTQYNYGQNSKQLFQCTAILSSQNRNFHMEKFAGGRLISVLGSINLDLSTAVIDSDVYLDISTLLSGVEVKVPTYANIVVNSTPILGEIEDHTRNKSCDTMPTIYVNTTCILGGVNIKN